jgi:spore coat polysaccharide biosynthesis protein SpsF
VDLVTNVLPRSFPKGQSVEVIAAAALGRLLASTDDAEDREHVTRYVYRNPGAFRIATFQSPSPRPDMQLSVDTPEDFERVGRILARIGAGRLPPTVEELVALADSLEVEALAP